MAVTPSQMIPLGTKAPNFTLKDVVSGKTVSLSQLKSKKANVVVFMCAHCPFVKHVEKELVKLANDFIPKGVSFIAISSNDVLSYPEDSPENMKRQAKDFKFPFPYLYDETQEIARAYGAECTPDFFVFDDSLHCVYRGQFDDSRPGNQMPVTGEDLRKALRCLLEGKPISENQKPSSGCNIKWKH
ncbi:MAG: Thioredoxin family protein [uncultured bacterium]|nr:MAG: Thioredoxin family protein [uncultured bacterium]OFW69082.1 MAG: alkyl hydroperoxide reductase [Alphaproteobacteria bacterium GWC2_42_16]OFW73939.1 MAG: alkyl hydroperoxide reductase [Alphaproteobacteria bacterium GWA2_41_27]OFW82478.1 MAG: alkyl hydroperoxide reductase [Alphaproteobacteria bacterium RIFCSPHIGHO2_12_FULL_42_100]OFW86603.1 MAG: alkyl hydroperoxide reductase [Alphaproteobacteria bacterium RBG_16_42_14]OFW91489.1 MAG: alkyl hydroperoxide reductase [Alphaproteobacteria bac